MTEYARLTALDDPEKPHRSVWACPTGVFVKIHCKRADLEFGVHRWLISGSQCDAEGKALAWGDEPAILEAARPPHQFIVRPDRTEDREPIAAQLDREIKFVVARVERAALNAREADELDG